MNRVKKYSEFIRQQHKSNAINIQNKSLEDQENKFDEKFYSPELKQRFTLGNTDQKRSELQEKRNKVYNICLYCIVLVNSRVASLACLYDLLVYCFLQYFTKYFL